MAKQLYRVCWQVEGSAVVEYGGPTTKDAAECRAALGNKQWGSMIVHWVEPVPPYEPPAITHEDDLTTQAGSPRDPLDLLGLEGLE